ncbi:MAG: hypothetical protein E7434_09070 [Ruminococcaceae bacterium]|nr:hypothetical protein [Oscillospiraceae bacterium]
MRKTGLFLLIAVLLLGITGCAGEMQSENSGEIVKLSFKETSGYDYLKTLDGQTVTINGYMATSSPVDGSFMFLMNLPYQNCPFCVPNTSQLSNTIEVYPKASEAFDYTAQAIKVTGTLVVAPSEDEPFTDSYGYEFNYKITDADYTIIQSQELSEEMQLWQEIANSDIVSDIYKMYDYVNFLCTWNTYYVNTYTNENGEEVPGYYLYASDAEHYIYTDGAQWNYGYQEGYFEGLIERIEAVDGEAFSDLVANIEKANALAQKALAELENGNYTSEYQYVEMFDTEDYVYTLTNGEALSEEFKAVYQEFSDWLSSWEL